MTIAPVPTRLDDVRSIINLCEGILAQVVSSYESVPLDLPARRYWTLQQPAADCEQVVVSFMQAYIGPPGDEAATPQRCNSPRSGALQVQIFRCIPVAGPKGRAPTADSIQLASEQLAMDAWLLLDIAGDLDQWDGFGGPGLGVIATVGADEPLGGYQSVTLNITTAIP